jgi:3-oxoacyl-[acyl-carrier protein] reductase
MAGPPDILVNNAAHAPTSLLAECSDEEFASTMTVNVMSPFMLMRDAARRMRDGGRIINISTLNTVLISPGTTAYAASKAALELMTRVAAAELGGRGITVNSVSPGATDTDMFRTANPAEGTYERVAAMTPLGRIGQPADVASVVAFLAGPDGRWLTGQNLRASGGLG